jgi:hypothetical protein
MTPATIIREAQADGVRLALSPAGTIKATGDKVVLGRWLPVIRQRKAEIVAALKAGAGEARSRWWRLHFADREPLEIACTPPASPSRLTSRHSRAIWPCPSSGFAVLPRSAACGTATTGRNGSAPTAGRR